MVAGSESSSFRLDIQGLRAVAVLLVVLDHAHVPGFTGGYIGVDVFFVISGFLITSHLLRTLETTGRVRFGEFYARRARRILPASLVVLVLTLAAAYLIVPPLRFADAVREAAATALYVPNVLFAYKNTDYLASDDPSLFQHYWSLGVEEQFYLAWPLVLLGIFLLFRRSRRATVAAVLGMVLLSLIACVYVTGWRQPWAFFLLPTRAWELGVGALLAFILASPKVARPRLAMGAGAIGLAAVVGSSTIFDETTHFPGYAAVLPVMGAALVIWAGSQTTAGPAARLLQLRPMVWVGEISYSLYLVHWPLLLLPAIALDPGNDLPLTTSVALAALAIPLAWLLHRFVEQPLRFAPALTRRRARVTIAAALVATVTAAGFAGALGLVDQTRDLYGGPAVAATAATAPPQATNYVPSNLTPGLRNVAGDNPEIYKNGCHLGFSATAPAECYYGDRDSAPVTIALFGDSHAAQWFPALRRLVETQGYYLESHTKSSCAPVYLPTLHFGGRYTACDQWQQAVVEHLKQDPVDVVIVSGSRRSVLDLRIDQSVDGDTAWNSALADLVSDLQGASTVVNLADTPLWPYDPAACVSAHLTDTSDCTMAPDDLLLDADSLAVEREAVESAGGANVDLNPYLCGETCPIVVGDLLVYRDRHHITATFSAHLAGVLLAELASVGAVPPDGTQRDE